MSRNTPLPSFSPDQPHGYPQSPMFNITNDQGQLGFNHSFNSMNGSFGTHIIHRPLNMQPQGYPANANTTTLYFPTSSSSFTS